MPQENGYNKRENILRRFQGRTTNSFPIVIGLFTFAFIGLQTVDCPGFTGYPAKPNRTSFSHSQRQIKSAAAKRKMNQSKLLPVGIWGGSGVLMRVGQKKITVEYACANGEIPGRLKLDGSGNFRADGVHLQPRPGPIRVNDTPTRQPARFEGKISGKNMTLRVTLIKSNEVIGDFELKRDVTPRIHRCL